MKREWWLILGIALVYALTKGAEVALAVKPGVSLSTTPQVQVIRNAVRRVWAKYGLVAMITSSLDGVHKQNSKHYIGMAEDFRTHDIPANLNKAGMVQEVQSLLGYDYQAMLEYENTDNEHMHVEYDPKGVA